MAIPEQRLPASFDTISSCPASTTTPVSSSSTSYDPIRLSEDECLVVLNQPIAARAFGHLPETESLISQTKNGEIAFTELVTQSVSTIFQSQVAESESEKAITRSRLLHVGYAALLAFVQSNVTGPPLSFRSDEVVIPSALRDGASLRSVREKIIRDLSVDGEAVYKLTPNVELFAVAKAILTHAALLGSENKEDTPLMVLTARVRVNLLHQKLLSENTDTLQSIIYADLDTICQRLLVGNYDPTTKNDRARFLLERAAIHTQYGNDSKARKDLQHAADINEFEFALTGKLGKRTKFQDRDISQLVVLAKGADNDVASASDAPDDSTSSKPANLDLNDDTLLEGISFKKDGQSEDKSMTIQDESSLPPSLAVLDPSSQPRLNPLNSIVLLSLASAITNTSPDNGLTREETLPYATRVLEGGSSNWQVYSQALLVRSRIEGYKSRTIERGVLQLQALVDQVIADTASDAPSTSAEQQQPTTFLPRPEGSESAPASERLEYLWLLNFSTRWSLEAELAARWVSLGGLRTALDIYERLQMWAEAALCHAATEREDKAKAMVRRQLFQPTNVDADDENDTYQGPELSILPPDAPRLFCILGDIDRDAAMYERAWEVSKGRYARAQRSLARLYLTEKPPLFNQAEEAYRLSLKISRLNHGAWFALGCVQLELEKWGDAVESFMRTVQIEESDAEAWSNLAAALVNMEPAALSNAPSKSPKPVLDDEEDDDIGEELPDPNKPKWDALAALNRAARFKHNDHRIWDNILTVGASIPPPQTPFRDVILAQTRIIEIRGSKDGEKCIDLSVLAMLIKTLTLDHNLEDHISNVSSSAGSTSRVRPGSLPAQVLKLVDDHVVPLITHSAPLWLLVAEVEIWRGRPSRALLAHEKAWRTTVASCTQGAFQMGTEKKWMEVVAATETLVRRGYAVYGGMDKEKDDGSKNETADGVELVAKDWRFKARSAVRGILGKGREFWEDSEGWLRLKALAEEVTGS